MKLWIRLGKVLVAVLVLLLMIPGTAGAVSANPASVNYGNVPLNTTVTQSIAITLDAGYQVSGWTIGASAFTISSLGTCYGYTGPGTCNVTESFTPTAVQAYNTTFTIFECTTASSNCPGTNISMQGNGVSVAAANPASVTYGNVPLNTTVTKSIAITLDAGYKVSGASGATSAPFAFASDTCASSSGTGPGTCNVTESFTPTAIGPASATLSVNECPTAGGTCLPVNIPLLGDGATLLSITTASLPNGTFGTVYPTTLQAAGGTGAYTWTGTPPPGLSLDASTGEISGTPTTAGTFKFSVTVTDSGSPTPQTATKSLSMKILGVADLSLSIAAPPGPVSYPKPITYAIVVKDLGPTNATGVVVTNSLPSGGQFVSANTSQGSCITPPVGSTGTMACSLGALANGATATINVTLDSSLKKTTLTTTATVAPDGDTIDPVSADNTTTAAIQVK